jgi:hypothetical protein
MTRRAAIVVSAWAILGGWAAAAAAPVSAPWCASPRIRGLRAAIRSIVAR